MKIKLINHPYKEYGVGEVVDLGEEKNKSMVSIGRAVWELNNETPSFIKKIKTTKQIITNKIKDEVVETKQEIKSDLTKPSNGNKKLLTNKLQQKVQAKRSTKKKTFTTKKR